MQSLRKVAFFALVGLAACGVLAGCKGKSETAGGPFPGKIAIVTNTVSQNEEEYRSAQYLVAKYGTDKVVHVLWPDNFMAEQEQMITTVSRLAANKEIRAIIINQAVPGTNPAIDKFLENRNDDVFIVYCSPQENPPDVSKRANLILNTDDIARGPALARQAQAMGAKTIVHYSFPRHMSNVLLSGRRDEIRRTAESLGMVYVDATAPDPTSDVGTSGAQQFIYEDVPKMIARYGKDTAFFSTNCAMQIPLINRIVAGGAIYPEPCDPSPLHGFPSALGIETGDGPADVPAIIAQIRSIVAEQGVEGRLATWVAPAAMAWTIAGAEYAIKWINGEVPAEGIDDAALIQAINTYVKEVTGLDDAGVKMSDYTDPGTGETYSNYKLLLMDYLVF
jgi:hypothetical protein